MAAVLRSGVMGCARCAGRVEVGVLCRSCVVEVAHNRGESVSPSSAGAGLVRHGFTLEALELCLVGTTAAASGGSLLVRRSGTEAWTERALAPLEFQLIRTLWVRAHEQAGSAASVKGCV